MQLGFTRREVIPFKLDGESAENQGVVARTVRQRNDQDGKESENVICRKKNMCPSQNVDLEVQYFECATYPS